MVEVLPQDNHQLKKKAFKGFLFLGLRRILLQVILTTGNIILARLLVPAIFGAFSISQGIVSFCSMFAGLGLTLALVQQKQKPDRKTFRIVFTINLLMALLVAGLVILLAPFLAKIYALQLGNQGVSYIRWLAFGLILAVPKELSLVFLERRLAYHKIVFVEVLEILIMQVSAVVLAINGFGVFSFIWSLILSRLLAVFIFYLLAPWPILPSFSFKKVSQLLSFGANYQLGNIITGLNVAIIPIYIGKVSGAVAVGLLNWAAGLAVMTRVVAEILGRLIFTVACRSQDDQKLLRNILEKCIQLSALTCFPLMVLLLALARPVTYLIYTANWLPGIPALLFFIFQSGFLVFSTLFNQILLALGKAKLVRNISLFWTLSQWLLTIPLVARFGFNGFGLASFLVAATFFIPLKMLRQELSFSFGINVYPYLTYSVITGLVIYLITYLRPSQSIFELGFMTGLGCIIYLTLIWWFKRDEIKKDWLKIKPLIFINK